MPGQLRNQAQKLVSHSKKLYGHKLHFPNSCHNIFYLGFLFPSSPTLLFSKQLYYFFPFRLCQAAFLSFPLSARNSQHLHCKTWSMWRLEKVFREQRCWKIKSLYLAAWTWANWDKFSIDGKGHSPDTAAPICQTYLTVIIHNYFKFRLANIFLC